jgi:hypothetical protein
MGFLTGLLGLDSGKATKSAAKQNQAQLSGLNTRGQGYINTGEQQSAGFLQGALNAYQPYAQTGQAANSMYGNALGLNGADGNAAATGAFQAGPGYQFAVDQSMQAAQRGAAAGGMLSSGNTMMALQDRGNQLANQEYGGWLQNLGGLNAQGFQAAQGQAQGNANLANLYQQTADQRLGFDSSVTQGRMGANNQYASGAEQQAAGLAGLGTSIGGFLGGKLGGVFKGF